MSETPAIALVGQADAEASDWNEYASDQWRLKQARDLIESITYIHPLTGKPIRRFVLLDRDRDQNGGAYRELDKVMADRVLRGELLEEMRKMAGVVSREYQHLLEIARLTDEAVDAPQTTPI